MINLRGYSFPETIYQGGDTVVYRGTRSSDGAPAICKLLNVEYPSANDLSSFRREYEISAKIGGEGAVEVYELARADNSLAIIMEDFGGISLDRREALRGPGLGEKLLAAARIAEALALIHGSNIIHKDVNPANILRNPTTGEVRIIDFGIAAELSWEATPGLGALEGTLPYSSPEQTGRMNRPLDYRTDLYSLGVTLYELFTGKLPFSGKSDLELVYAHIAKTPEPPRAVDPGIPETISAIILKLMSKAAEDRYQSASGLAKDLNRCVEEFEGAGSVGDFPLGLRDGSDVFAVPHKLYGRDEEITLLQETYSEAAEGCSRLLLVAGAPGVGKTSLIREIHKSDPGAKGFLISGKFDESERNIPYSAFIRALGDLMDQMLCLSSEFLEDFKNDLRSALGVNLGVLVDFIPGMDEILGPQAEPPPLEPVAAQNRLQLAVGELFGVFVRKGHPVAVFLDDLQWSDSPTLDLVEHLLGANGVSRLLVVGAYRDNEVGEGHPLPAMLRKLEDKSRDTGSPYRKLNLAPLGFDFVNQLIADALRRDADSTHELASVVYGKTGGNPFFTRQMLSSLHARGAFTYDAADDSWDWTLGEVREADLGDNVIDFLVKRLRSFSAQTMEILRIAACVGGGFDLKTLLSVRGQGFVALAGGLWDAMMKEIIVPLNRNYRLLTIRQGDFDFTAIDISFKFQHDRILQAVLSTISEEEKVAIHYGIGREMLKDLGAAAPAGYLFELVNHLNIGRPLASGKEELLRIAELNAAAGRRAMESTAFRAAADYFLAAESLVPEGEWTRVPGGRFALSLDYTKAVFLGGGLREASELVDALFPLATSGLERAAAFCLKSRILEFDGDLAGAIDEIRKSLLSFGLILPEDRGDIDRRVGEGVGAMRQGFARTPIEELVDLREMEDSEKIMAMSLLAQVVPAAIQYDYSLYMVATMMMMELTLAFGVTPDSCKCIADCGIIYSSVLGEYETGYRLGMAAFALIGKLKAERQKPAVCFSFTYVSHMRKHYREGLDYYEMSYRTGMECGDTQHAAYARAHKVHLMMWAGVDLRECRREAEGAIAFLRESQALIQLELAKVVLYAIDKLRSVPDRDEALGLERKDEEIVADLGRKRNVVLVGRFAQYNAFLHYILGDMDAAEKWNAKAESVIFAAGTDFPVADHYLVQSLIYLDKLRKGGAEDGGAALGKISSNLARLKKFSDNCPENFAHKYYLVSAELSAFKGEPLETTIDLFGRALDSIGAGEFPQMTALINERQGALWLDRGSKTIAKAFLREAYYHYGLWGARRKLAAMKLRYPELSAFPDDEDGRPGNERGHAISNVALDMDSIVKSTQAISGEMKTEKLLKTFMHAIVENAGAQSGCLLLLRGDGEEPSIEAIMRSGSDSVEIVDSLPLAQGRGVCRAIVKYVERTREGVVLGDAASEGGFGSDGYIRERGVKSVLCMPVIHRNDLRGIVYLENNLAYDVFTTERLDILKILASQAAISFENVRLYEDMETKVRERTLMLKEANEKLRELTLIDPLTNLSNRRYFHDYIAAATERYIRKLERCLNKTENRVVACPEAVLGLCIVDIDHFKEVNDTWGHAAGDDVLVAVSKLLKSLVRSDDFVVRWGGEEFLLILNNTDPAYLGRFARKVLQAVADASIELPGGGIISRTCSLGYAQIPFCEGSPGFLSLEQTIKLCDYAMYVAKRRGRDCAVGISPREGAVADEAFKARLLALSSESDSGSGIVDLEPVFREGRGGRPS
jgi:histidine kinase